MFDSTKRFVGGVVAAAIGFIVFSVPIFGQDCTGTSVGLTPINDLGTGLYLSLYQGGLYPSGLNTAPAAHEAEGLARSFLIEPLDTFGNPSPTGKYILLSIGMSNTTQEFCSGGSFEPCTSWSFMGQAAVHPVVNHTALEIVNGAKGGQTAMLWDDPSDANYDRIVTDQLTPQGFTEAQVQVAWVKVADAGPTLSLPNVNADAYQLQTHTGNIMRAMKVRYPNLKIVFLSSRIYAGYATSTLNPEPYAYESAFASKWTIEAQVNQMAGGPIDAISGDLDFNTVAPWIAWGPYLWADGLNPRSDGFTWECLDMQPDGTHPAMVGQQKVGTLLMDFMLTSPFAIPWFLESGVLVPTGDCDDDLDVDLTDYAHLTTCLAGPGIAYDTDACLCIDFDVNSQVDMLDFREFSTRLTVPPPDLDPAVDDFERESLGSNWLSTQGTLTILNGSDLGIQATGIGIIAWQGSSFSADQYGEGEIASGWNPQTSLQLNVRLNTSSGARYGLRWLGGGTMELRYTASGQSVLLGTATGQTLVAGDTLRLEAQGTTLRGFKNSSQIIIATDSNLSSGTAGIAFSADSGSVPAVCLESWTGGSLP
ncbi:MAG: hypothetical protein AABZ47_07985 [Planctomycetota bacterium]